MSHLVRATVVVAALLATSAAPATGGAAAAGATRLEPDRLARGADLVRPYVEGQVVVDGDLRVPVDLRRPVLLGRGPGGWVVADRRTARALLVDRDGSARRLPGASTESVLSADGRFYATAGLVSDGETVVAVRRTRDGTRVASQVFRSWIDENVGRFVSPIDVAGRRVLLGGSGGRVMVWQWPRDRLRTVKDDRWHLQAGSLADDVAAGWTAPGQRCTFVAPLSHPGRQTWRSCTERVLAFAPGGRRMVTVDNGVDPSFQPVRQITLRRTDGRVLGRWSAVRIEDVTFESATRVTFRLVGTTHTSMVRCSASRCANASDPVPVG